MASHSTTYSDMLTRRRFLSLFALGGLGAVGAGGLAVADTYRFQVNRYQRVLPGLKRSLRVVQLSDLHFGPWVGVGLVRAWVQAANAERPDLVVVTGDLVDSGLRLAHSREVVLVQAPELDLLVQELAQLKAPLGVWAIWGNHDNNARASKDYLARQLPKQGIEILVNQGIYPRQDLYLSGVDDCWSAEADARKALAGYRPGSASLALAHNPDYLDFYYRLPVTLALCGHTHGGQVFLPVIGAPWTPSFYQQTYLGGWYDPGHSPGSPPVPAFVSRGLGTTLLPLRINAPAELVVFDFIPVG